jgi:hypothetical protein
LRLCAVHTRRLAEDPPAAADIYRELSLQLRAARQAGQRVSGSGEQAGINEAAADARRLIRHVLVSWMKLVCDVRGISPPTGHLGAVGTFLARHAEWLAASDLAADASAELHDLAHGQPWRIAYPGSSGTRVRELRQGRTLAAPSFPCPDCGHGLRAVIRADDDRLPAEITCDNPEPHTFPAYVWRELGHRIRKAVA